MGNSAPKQKTKPKLQLFKRRKKANAAITDMIEIVPVILLHWSRMEGLSAAAFENISSDNIINTILYFTKHAYFMDIADKILSIRHFTPKQMKYYNEEKNKNKKFETFITKQELLDLCDDIQSVIEKEDLLIKLNIKQNDDQKVIIFGDIRGDLLSLFKHFDSIHEQDDTENMNIIDKICKYNDIYLFLGSYVCRGWHSIECISLLYCLKLMFPKNIYLLRGYQECAPINRIYGFYDEIKRTFPFTKKGENKSEKRGILIWKRMNETFKYLSYCAVINDKYFCVHGGLSPELNDINTLNSDKYTKPITVPDTGLFCDLLWSDPEQIMGWGEQDKGVSYIFGEDVVEKFLKRNHLEMIIRTHQVVEQGFEWFGKNNKLLTLFSTAHFCQEFDNDAAIMILKMDDDVTFDLKVLLCTEEYKAHMNVFCGRHV